jgi:tetratricopeptide (TPR) repeat protein
VVSFAELTQLSQILAQDEPDIGRELDKAYRKATSDEERLAVVRRFLLLSPHSTPARRRLIALLESLGRKESLAQEVEHMRAEPFIDAGLLAQGASSLRRIGLEADGRRAFGELIERAPNDPWTLAFVGDRLRAEGMFDEAGAAYDSLERLIPNEAAVSLRLALAHAGAGRLDVATRLLERVTQTGGRNDSQELGELASITEAVLLAEARGAAQGELAAQLDRRLLRTPLPDVGSVLMVLEPPSDDPIVVRVLGMAAIRVERGEGKTRLRLSRAGDPGPSRPRKAQVFALVLSGDDKTLRLVRRDVDVAADGKPVELEFSGGEFL